jgi:(heptosyl)LPS beta-1,4-glucosyltransferase
VSNSVRISTAIITLNEEQNIIRALESVAWTDEVIVIDSGSSDQTVDICQEWGARVIAGKFDGYVRSKNRALRHTKGDWVLSIDADEEVTPELRKEIEQIIADDKAADGYRIPRKNHYLGKWVKHCGWYPDYQLRLWRRDSGQWVGGRVHERVNVNGEVRKTNAALNHFTYHTLEEHIIRMNKYAGLHANDRFDEGKRTSYISLLFAPLFQFIKLYLLRLGVFDGLHGLMVSSMGSYYAFLKKAKLIELQLKQKKSADR